MKNLILNQAQDVSGGILPAIYGGLMAYNYAVAVYGGSNVAYFAAGAAVAFLFNLR